MKNEIINTAIGQMSKTLDSIQLKNLEKTWHARSPATTSHNLILEQINP